MPDNRKFYHLTGVETLPRKMPELRRFIIELLPKSNASL